MKIYSWLGKKLIKIAILAVFLIPSIALAQFEISGPATLTSDPLEDVLERVIVGILGLVSIIGILYLIYGSIRYVASAGNDSDIEEAKTIIKYALWGLFLTASAYALVKTVISFAG